jgi:hypothetical protein
VNCVVDQQHLSQVSVFDYSQVFDVYCFWSFDAVMTIESEIEEFLILFDLSESLDFILRLIYSLPLFVSQILFLLKLFFESVQHFVSIDLLTSSEHHNLVVLSHFF